MKPKPNPKMQKLWDNLIKTGFPPSLKSFTVSPPAPVAGKPITVTATFFTDLENATKEAKKNHFEVVKGLFSFSTDGGKHWTFPAMMKKVKVNVFTYTLQPQAAGTTILANVKGEDIYGNLYSEISCPVTGDPLVDPCMADSAKDENPVDDPGLSVPDAQDFLRLKVGYNKDGLVVVNGFQGRVNGGTLNPLKLNAYITGFVESKNPKNLGDLFTSGKLGFYAPLIKTLTGQVKAQGNDIPIFPPCGLISARPGANEKTKPNQAMTQDTANISCVPSGSILILKIKWAGVNPKFKQTFRLFASNFTLTSILPPNLDVKDWTRPTHMVIAQHAIKVK